MRRRQDQAKNCAPQLERSPFQPGPDFLLQPEQHERLDQHKRLGANDDVGMRSEEAAKRPQPKPKARRRRQQLPDAPPQGRSGQEPVEHHRLTQANLSQFEGLPMIDPDYRNQPALTARIVQEQQEEIEEKRQSAEREMRVWDAKWTHLRYQSTFLDVGMSGDLGDLSPRASSDPGSESARSSSFNFMFEHEYVDQLSERMRLPTGDLDPTVMREDLLAFSSSRCNSLSVKSCATDITDGLLRRSQPQLDKPSQGGPPISKQSLREHIQQTSKEIVGEVHMQRLNMALTAIEELPEHVEELLQRNATTMADNVQAELGVMRDTMRELRIAEEPAKVAQAEIAVTAIEAIPDIIQNSFEARIEVAKELVRNRLTEVAKTAQVVDVNSSESVREEVVQQMRCIPAKVEQIANQTIANAVMESKMQASEQFKVAMEALASHATARPEETLIEHTKQQIVNTDWAPTVKPVLHAANAAVEQVVAIMQGTDEVKEQVANQVVADALLQAKVEQMAPNAKTPMEEPGVICGKPTGGAAKQTDGFFPCNPGSIGHPELCPRPCLYFMAGTCANGSACDFCHLSHPKRPAHLDKRHREMVRDMPYSQCLGLILPILKEKMERISFGEHEMSMLQELAKVPADDDFFKTSSEWPDEAQAKATRSLMVALKAMSIRSLLMTLHRAGQTQGGEISPNRTNATEAMIQRLRFRATQSSRIET